jgi:hypothetical protein
MSHAIGSAGSHSTTAGVGQAREHGAHEARKHHKHEKAMEAMGSLNNGMGTGADPGVAQAPIPSGGQAAASNQQADSSLQATAQRSA